MCEGIDCKLLNASLRHCFFLSSLLPQYLYLFSDLIPCICSKLQVSQLITARVGIGRVLQVVTTCHSTLVGSMHVTLCTVIVAAFAKLHFPRFATAQSGQQLVLQRSSFS